MTGPAAPFSLSLFLYSSSTFFFLCRRSAVVLNETLNTCIVFAIAVAKVNEHHLLIENVALSDFNIALAVFTQKQKVPTCSWKLFKLHIQHNSLYCVPVSYRFIIMASYASSQGQLSSCTGLQKWTIGDTI